MQIEQSVTLSVIKGDVGSVGGHLRPTKEMLHQITEFLQEHLRSSDSFLNDFYVTHAGDDIMLLLHHSTDATEQIEEIALRAFQLGARLAEESGCYAAGQDLTKEATSGNIRGSGLGLARLTFVPRKGETVVVFATDKTNATAFSIPLARTFLDPFTTPGLLLDRRMHQGFRIRVIQLRTGATIELHSKRDRDEILMLIGDTERFAIKEIISEATGEALVNVSSEILSQLHSRYVGKDDPVAIVRTQSGYPSTGEYTQPFAKPIIVPGWMRGSCYGALFPCCAAGSLPTMFDGPPRVIGLAFNITTTGFRGKELTKLIGAMEPIDLFLGHEWDQARTESLRLNQALRQQGPFIPGRLPAGSVEYSLVEELFVDRIETAETDQTVGTELFDKLKQNGPTRPRRSEERPAGEERPYDRPRFRSNSDRPSAERRTYDRPFRERRTYDRPFGERPPFRERTFRDRPFGERRTYDRPITQTDESAPVTGSNGAGNDVSERSHSERRTYDRPFRERRTYDRPSGERRTEDRPRFEHSGSGTKKDFSRVILTAGTLVRRVSEGAQTDKLKTRKRKEV